MMTSIIKNKTTNWFLQIITLVTIVTKLPKDNLPSKVSNPSNLCPSSNVCMYVYNDINFGEQIREQYMNFGALEGMIIITILYQ